MPYELPAEALDAARYRYLVDQYLKGDLLDIRVGDLRLRGWMKEHLTAEEIDAAIDAMMNRQLTTEEKSCEPSPSS